MPHTIRTPIAAFVFDAYGTLFDVYAVGALAERLAPGHGADLARLWRTKQLEYTWLQSLMAGGVADRREDFDRITAHALDFAVAALALPFGSAQKQELRDAYRHAHRVPGCARRARRAGAAPALDPVQRHAGRDQSARAQQRHGDAARRCAVGRCRRYLQAGTAGVRARRRQLAPAAGTHRLRVVELLGRDRRPRLRIHDVLDQPYRRTARSPRSAAAAHSCLARGAARLV